MAAPGPESPDAPLADEQRYGWPGVDAGDPASRLASIARHLIHAGCRTIGFLAARRALDQGQTLGPLLASLGQSLTQFTTQSIGLVASWSTWAWATAPSTDSGPFRSRALGDRLIEVAPLPCADPEAAVLALQTALAALAPTLVTTLVDLTGYAPAGRVPAALDVVDGAVLVARARHTQGDDLIELTRPVGSKNIGTILIGPG